MNIQEHLEAFDSWLTGRIEEAYAGRMDLAFRDVAPESRVSDKAWEYSLLDPGANSPQGEGWSVYRLQGVWPKFITDEAAPAPSAPPARKSLLGALVGALRGPDSDKPR